MTCEIGKAVEAGIAFCASDEHGATPNFPGCIRRSDRKVNNGSILRMRPPLFTFCPLLKCESRFVRAINTVQRLGSEVASRNRKRACLATCSFNRPFLFFYTKFPISAHTQKQILILCTELCLDSRFNQQMFDFLHGAICPPL